MITKNSFRTKSGKLEVALPLFIPVYRPDYSFVLFSEESYKYGLNAVMVNSFLLFRDRNLRTKFGNGYTLREHIGGFNGLLCTDSGAFQQLSGRKLDLDPAEIVRFQNMIKTDVAAPLDLITPPKTDFDESYRRMVISQHRIEEAVKISDYSDLAGIQQGGGFYSLRQKHIWQLANLNLNYYGIGSMVPFFNKNHNLFFTCKVINDARSVIGIDPPLHVYGAGDPLEIAFMFYAGANIFDSSSYAHYARQGYYMTPYGAINRKTSFEQLGYECSCPICNKHDLNEIFSQNIGEELRKQHNLFVILETVRELGEYSRNNNIEAYLSKVYDKHVNNIKLFPNSMLEKSWEEYLSGKNCDCAAGQNISASAFVYDGGNVKMEKTVLRVTETEQLLLEFLAKESAHTYKMDYETILKFLTDELLLPKNANFRIKINDLQTLKDVKRLSEFKSFRKNVRSNMYQKLRKYKASDHEINHTILNLVECTDDDMPIFINKLLEGHVSTRERLPSKDQFVSNICKSIKPGSLVIDIGCGFNPLLFPVEFYNNVSSYIAVDKDPVSTEVVRIFAKKNGIENLHAFTWDISNGLSALERLTGIERYDFAILLKVIPVVNRADLTHKNENVGIPVLGKFPAMKMLTTVSRESMTKYESIEKRETATLRQFIQTYGFNIESEFSCGSEFGYYLSKENYHSLSESLDMS